MKNTVLCNVCGREIETKAVTGREDYLFVRKEWGYFSHKDGDIHSWRMCEGCYDKFVSSFAVPPEAEETTEYA